MVCNRFLDVMLIYLSLLLASVEHSTDNLDDYYFDLDLDLDFSLSYLESFFIWRKLDINCFVGRFATETVRELIPD